MNPFASVVKNLLLIAAILAGTPISAQTLECGFDARHQQMMLTDPDYQQRVADFNDRAERFDVDALRGGGTLFVPVVVHVMETGTAITAITDDQIRNGIRWLNERYRKVAGTPGAGNGVDTNIEFALAVRDPNGSCTTGITRHDMTGNATYMASGVFDASAGITDASLKTIGVWNQSQYYNIWLVSEFDNNNGGSGLQGYAYFSSSHGTSVDGTVMLVNAYKDPVGITLAHELGHAFNVYHTFEGDVNGTTCPGNATCATLGDLVCDTPPHIRSASDCNVGGTNACDGNSSNALFKNNYMDYSGDVCQNMFTAGQNVRIQAALTVDRASFLAVNGNLSLVPPGPPTMDMIASSALLCGVGQSVTLSDWSRCIPNTYLTDPGLPGITFAWTITNGTETHNSTVQNPTFTLNSTGVYNVTLATTTGLGTFTRTEQGMVVVVAAPVAACSPTSTNAGNFAQTVSNVVFNTISNPTSTITNVAYTNLSCSQNTVVAMGGTYPLSVTINAGGSAAESLNGYIDYNNNGVFEDPSERVITGSTPTNTSTTLNANVTIPGGAVTNTLLRMRIYGEAGTLTATERTCGAAFFIGDVEDYGVYITNNMASVTIAAAPGSTITYGTPVTFTPTPVNGGASPVYTWYRNGVDVGTSATYVSSNLLPGETVYCSMVSNLAGVIGSPDLSNTITMTVTGPPLSEFAGSPLRICAGSSVTFTDQSLLSPTSWSWTFTGGTPSTSTSQNPVITYAAAGTYNVTLVASNVNGAGSTMTKTGYITVYAAPTAGCVVTRSTAPTSGIGITNVTLNTINKTTVYDGAVMNDYTCSDNTVLSANTLYNISVTVGAFNNQWVRVYIDYNGDGDFVDGGEQIFAPANGLNVRSGSFTTPVAPTPNVLRRMRVISDFVNTTPGSCTTPVQYGQVEEYGIVFLGTVNTAPVLSAVPSPALTAQNEDAGAPSGAVGTLVSALVDLNPPAGGLDNVTDADAGALTGIAITAADATNGTWFYSINNGGAWSALGAPSGVASRLLAADANSRLYFQPNANFNGAIATAITFRAWDQTSGTNGATADVSTNGGTTAFSTTTDVASLTVTAINDAPVLSTVPSPALTAQNEDAAAPSGAVGTLVSALIDLNPPAGALDNATDVDAGAVTGIAITAADATNGTWFYSINNGGAWNALGVPSGVASRLLAADANARLYFQPNANFNGAVATAITIRAWDQTSGTNGSTADASTNGGTTAFSTATDVASLTVTAINDAPVLSTVPSPALTAQNEDAAAPSGAVGTLVSALIDLNPPAGALDNATDVDAGAVTGMAITAADATNGTWFYSINNGVAWNALGVPSGAASRLLAADANSRLYFQPNTNFNGSIASAITFRAWDQTSGTAGTTVTTAANGGATAFSAATDVASLVVTAVNDAPQATNLSAAESYTEDVSLNLIDIVVSDVDHATTTATLTLSNVSAGSLTTATSGAVTSTFSAGVWTASGAIANVNTLLAGVTFVPAANFSTGFSITTSVSDGVAAPVTGSKPMIGTAVNDAPTATNLSAAESYTEDVSLNLIDIVVSDVDHATTTATLTLSDASVGSLSTATSGAVTSIFSAGVWTASGAIANVNILLAGVTFVPAANFSTSFNITTSVSDGVAAPVTGSKPMTGTAVNDAPTATNLSAAESYTEDVSLNLIDIVVSDVDHATTTATLTLSNVSAGSLSTATSGAVTSTFSAGVWTASGAIANVNTLLAGVTFVPALNFNSSFNITTSVSDGVAAPVTGSKPMTGIVVNDAPVITSTASTTATEDVLYTYNATHSDLDGPTVSWTLLPAHTCGGSIHPTSGVFTFTPAGPTPPASCVLAVQVCDGGAPDLCATQSATVNIGAVNDAPVNTVPGAQATNQNTPLTLSAGNGNLVSIADADAGASNVEVTLSVANGNLTLATTTGLTFSVGDGTTDGNMVFEGTTTAINLALNGMVFSPTTAFSGAASLSITTIDLGNTGAGGELTDVDILSITVVPTSIQVSVRAFLDGPYNPNTGLMGDGLRSGGHIPASQPYSALGYTFLGNNVSGPTVAPAVLAVTGSNAIVDWVIVELRDNLTPTIVVANTPALVQCDGDVVANDGVSPLGFTIAPGTYRVAMRHRNHLAVMTLAGVGLSASPTTVDFTSLATSTFGTNARKGVTGTFPTQSLWAGDVTFNGQVKYAGGGNDRDPILVKIGGLVPTATVNGYWPEDVNLNGQVKYAGGSNDRDPILVTIGGTIPTAVRLQQLP